MYLWEQSQWPNFRWDSDRLMEPLGIARHAQGRFLGKMEQLGFGPQQEAQLRAVTDEVVKSSDIEGEALNPVGVRSSVARHLGVPWAGLDPAVDPRVEGVVEMTLDATLRFAKPLSTDRLKSWHGVLFPEGRSGWVPISVGSWRRDGEGPMQVVSGPVGRRRVHYEAPPAARISGEMKKFLSWFNRPFDGDGLLRAALAHFWFVTVHPFDDGNGRLARAVGEMALAQLEKSSMRFYSLSSQIRRERGAYYDVLEQTQKGSLDVSGWLLWFVGCFQRALGSSEAALTHVLRRADFWKRHAHEPVNPRQQKVMNCFLDDFEGKLTAKKWAALTKCSADTAQRDIADLLQRGLLVKNPGGSKNTSYSLALD